MDNFSREQVDWCRRAYAASNYGAILEALRYLAVPNWVRESVSDLLQAAIRRKTGKYTRWRRQHVNDLIDGIRFETVLEAHETGRITFADAYEFASQALVGTACAAVPAEMRRSYLRFKKRQRDTPGRYLITREDTLEMDNLAPVEFTDPLRKALGWAEPRRGKGRTITRSGS